jgi:hypothetical protein
MIPSFSCIEPGIQANAAVQTQRDLFEIAVRRPAVHTRGMGLVGDWIKSKNMKDPVRGTLQVTASTYPPDGATSGNFSINGIVSADGIPPTAVEHSGIARTKKWPHGGQTLPVTVDRADPSRLSIEWDEVADSWDTARQSAQAMADAMRTGGAGGAAGAAGAGVGAAGIPPQALDVLRQMGIDPSAANVQVVSGGEAFTTTFGAPAEEEDPAARLRKLQELRRDELITEEEYEAQRARVLGDL